MCLLVVGSVVANSKAVVVCCMSVGTDLRYHVWYRRNPKQTTVSGNITTDLQEQFGSSKPRSGGITVVAKKALGQLLCGHHRGM